MRRLGGLGGLGRLWDGWECEPKPANAWSWVCGGDCGTDGAGETSGRAEKAVRIGRVGVGYFSGV